MKQRQIGQISMTDEIIVDSFAGGGGASTGIEVATGRVVNIAINHDADAILMHSINHPFTEHYQASVWDIDPVEVCKGRPVGLAWFSPDCFVAGTLILTRKGYKPIEEVRVGDLVLTHKGRWRPVVETMTSKKPIYKVRGYGNPGLVCSGKHPFYTATKDEAISAVFKEAKDLKPGKDYWGIHDHFPETDVVDELTNVYADKDMAWLAGRYVGDGWLRMDGGHYETVITCGEQDIESLRSELNNHDCGFKWNFRRVRTGGQFTNCGKSLCVWLNDNFGRLSDKKTIPAWLYTAPAQVKTGFIDGYMSADGWKRCDGLNEASTVSKRLAYGLVQLLASMGLPATVYSADQANDVIEGRKVNVKPIWKVKWRAKIAEKHEQHFERDGIIWRPIREVTDLHREETVYNIGVADDESYVAEGVIVHNCKHFSKAKGAALVDRNIRGLAWIVLRWAAKVRPRVIMLENVEEFTTWGPVRKGKPVKSLSGTTFLKWKNQLRALGYSIEHRELVAADYGAPTSRKRFVLIARCDGRPIVWPERTHGPADSPDVKSGKLKPWRCAAEIIDWSLPMYSIFDSKAEIKERYGVNAVRPLADNTLRRIIRGVDKFTLKSDKPFILLGNFMRCGEIVHDPQIFRTENGQPFIVPTGYGERKGQAPRVHDIDDPLSTVVSTVKQNLCSVQMIQYHTEQTENVRANGLNGLLPTVDASNRYGLISASLTEYYGNGNPIPMGEAMRTVTSHDREALLACHLDKYYAVGYSGKGNSPEEPLTTITVEPRQSLVAAHIAEFKGQCKGMSVEDPLYTITASAGEFGLVGTQIVRYEVGAKLGRWPEIRSLLNKYCGYHMSENEVLLLNIGGALWCISDIFMRMLAPRELYNAMGFPPDYVIDFIDPKTGKDYPKSAKVARCGNAVCPPMAEAVVRANLPEWCGGKIETMEELRRHVAV